uniref:intraflagellar transport-associated protein isoform X2 n=1 Tax=Pristiophorus japonicus TaxID=55135 RepID=UPI00398F7B1A
MEEEGITFDALEKFCSSHEQTYDEFLETFIHLRKEDLKQQKASPPEVGSIAEDAGNSLVQRGGMPPKDDEELVGIGRKIAHFKREPKTRSKLEIPKKVDNYIDIEDIDSEKETEQQSDTGPNVLPGEIEETPADYSQYECKHTSLDFKVNPDVEEFNNKTHDQHYDQEDTVMVLTDDVQPFTLDEDFDYDCVYLKPKYTEEELKTISAFSKQQRESGDSNAAKLKDFDL